MQPEPASTAFAVAVALIGEYELGAVFFFSPGWATGRPFGLSFQAVLAAGTAIWFGVFAMTAAAGAGALLESVAALVGLSARRGWRLYMLWLCLWAAVIMCVSPWVFRSFYDWFWVKFPHGYDIE